MGHPRLKQQHRLKLAIRLAFGDEAQAAVDSLGDTFRITRRCAWRVRQLAQDRSGEVE